MHYKQLRRAGAGLLPKRSDLERFEALVIRSGFDSCWYWVGAADGKGYGSFWVVPKMVRAHRWSYEQFVAQIPSNLVIDHLCRNRSCVNPAHLEPVTNRENWSRGYAPSAISSRRTHCSEGHKYTAENTLHRADAGRRCRECARLYMIQWRARGLYP